MTIERNQEHGTIYIHQDSHIRMIVATFGMDLSRPLAIRMAMKIHKRKADNQACYPTICHSIIGSLMYAMTSTRPDVAYAIGALSRYNHHLSIEHMIALKCVFRYVNGMKDWQLHSEWEAECALGCSVDSDYAGCPDDYESTTGLVINFRAAVDWIEKTEVDYPVHDRCRILRLWSKLHEAQLDFAFLEWTRHPDYPTHVLRFTVSGHEYHEQHLLRNFSCTHCDQVLSCCRYG